MPEILKTDGDMDWSKIFMGFAVALVLIIQQVQSYRIAEIKAVGEVNKVNFMAKEDVHKVQLEAIRELHELEKKVEAYHNSMTTSYNK